MTGGHSKNILEQFDEPWTLTKMSFEDSSLGNCWFLEKILGALPTMFRGKISYQIFEIFHLLVFRRPQDP